MVRRFLRRGYSLDRFLPKRRVLSPAPSFSSSPSSSSPSSPSRRITSSRRESMDDVEEEAVWVSLPPLQKWVLSRSQGPRPTPGRHSDQPPVSSKSVRDDMEIMKERFSKLLLGEDMSGTGKGVSSALALSNAITNLAASVFGEQRRLEPMPADRRARWSEEIDLLLSVTDYIVEFFPLQQVSEDGTTRVHLFVVNQVMGTQQRRDILMNIPALRKLDAMLLEYLDNFKGDQEFSYVSKDADEREKGNAPRDGEKWWIPTVKVPPSGLSDTSKKWLEHQKDLVGQVLKAAMAINADVLTGMEIPEEYLESLPKNGRSCLGDSIYKTITDEFFDPNELLNAQDLSTEHKIVDLKDRIEASVVIWQRKICNKLSWGPDFGVSLEKREQFEERAQTVLLILKHQFPGVPQSSLDISKIQYNTDVGFAILESYSRALESLAFGVLSRIEDVLYANNVARYPRCARSRKRPSLGDIPETFIPDDDSDDISASAGNTVHWQGQDDLESRSSDANGAKLKKVPRIGTRRVLHIDKVEAVCGGGSRSFSQR